MYLKSLPTYINCLYMLARLPKNKTEIQAPHYTTLAINADAVVACNTLYSFKYYTFTIQRLQLKYSVKKDRKRVSIVHFIVSE